MTPRYLLVWIERGPLFNLPRVKEFSDTVEVAAFMKSTPPQMTIRTGFKLYPLLGAAIEPEFVFKEASDEPPAKGRAVACADAVRKPRPDETVMNTRITIDTHPNGYVHCDLFDGEMLIGFEVKEATVELIADRLVAALHHLHSGASNAVDVHWDGYAWSAGRALCEELETRTGLTVHAFDTPADPATRV